MKPVTYTRAQALPAILKHRIAILDGAMGTMIQRLKLTELPVPRGRLCRLRWRSATASRTFPRTSRATTNCCR